MSGLSVFYKDETGEIFHTYSTYGRGDEMVDTTYMYLDLTPKGRNETGPHYNLGDWVRHHDRYEAAGFVDAGGRFVAAQPRRLRADARRSPYEHVTAAPDMMDSIRRRAWAYREGEDGRASGRDRGRGLSF